MVDVDHAEAALPVVMQQQLAIELAALVLDSLAPEELPLLGETADEYFADSSAVLDPARRDEALGFGLSVDLPSPYVLAVVTPVVHFLLTAVADAMKQEARPRVEEFVRRLFRRHREPDRVETIGLKPDQARHLREIAIARARAVGVAESRAALLADAIVGSLVVSG